MGRNYKRRKFHELYEITIQIITFHTLLDANK